VVGNTLAQSFWRGNQGYSRTVPISNNEIQWNQASAWSAPTLITTLPGSGDMQAESEFVVGNTLTQSIWRGNQGFWRTVPISNNEIQWNQASAWSAPTLITTLPGSGDMQAKSEFVVGNTLIQSYWRSNREYWRTAPIIP
jgi:hypothetical protein